MYESLRARFVPHESTKHKLKLFIGINRALQHPGCQTANGFVTGTAVRSRNMAALRTTMILATLVVLACSGFANAAFVLSQECPGNLIVNGAAHHGARCMHMRI